ncbi:MAG: tRNA (guanosine(37)-N1)-methyltransferase TrmD [Proteobacteria bacterium]|nr:tRNA (guanosine(37)-N1)-methyltransferase TrmD [Pseudomonadota bacterium]
MMKFDILTLLPDFFVSALEYGVIGRAITAGKLSVSTHDIREYTTDRHRTVDDAPYGGGPGMVMKPDPIARAIKAVKGDGVGGTGGVDGADADIVPTVILVTPQGTPLTQQIAQELAKKQHLLILCGRYEGVDERARSEVDLELSIGDYVITGGEPAALVIVDAVGRLVPGVLGSADSPESDSYSDGLLEGPQYTRPEMFEGVKVPDVLLSGDHKRIGRWRRKESLRRTLERRPELLETAPLSDDDREIIKELKQEELKQGEQDD